MLEFAPINNKNMARVRACYRRCRYAISDYSLGVKVMWKSFYHSQVAFAAGCMTIKEKFDGYDRFDFPVEETDDADMWAAVDEIEKYCLISRIPLVFYAVPDDKLGELIARYRSVRIAKDRTAADYLYDTDKMMNFTGKHYSGQRNHINKFKKLYPEAVFRELKKEDIPRVEKFFEKFDGEFEKHERFATAELKHAKALLKHDFSWGCAGCMELDGKIISLAFGEICGETMIIHIEKALYEYEGIYPATVEAFAKRFCGGVRYINREEDMGDSGLRRSKEQYRPIKLLEKTNVFVDTELMRIKRVPTIVGERVVLDEITELDKPAYNKLCLDDERNKYWGYDYKTDCSDPDDDFFLNSARDDFANDLEMSMAVRVCGKFAGEAVIYEFDGRGGASVGIRLLPKYEGKGIAKEAIEALINYALYKINLSKVYAKCYKENVRSFKMLSSVMNRRGEDDKFFYFERSV